MVLSRVRDSPTPICTDQGGSNTPETLPRSLDTLSFPGNSMKQIFIEPQFPDELFGNDAAEFEDDDTFNSFVYEREDIKLFNNASRKICIAHAYKGEGKSSILKLCKARAKQISDATVVNVTGIEMSPNQNSWDIDLWSREWKNIILKNIACEVARSINMAWTDNATSLVEIAESNGFKDRSIVGYITERLAPQHKVRDTPIQGDIGKRIERYLNGKKYSVWLIVDDIDQNFENTKNHKVKLASFFDAIRSICISIPEIKVRFSIRPNVWKILKQEYASIGSHFDQFIVDIKWNEEQIRRLLANRIRGFMQRNSIDGLENFPQTETGDKSLISLVFEDPMNWNGGRPPHVVLDTLSRNRPRWLVVLCKLAYARARDRNSFKIILSDIMDDLADFGNKRIDDIVAEYSCQCQQVREIISAFKKQEKTYNNDQLSYLINKRVLNSLNPTISGVIGKVGSNEIIHFLYQIGFISARRERQGGGYDHVEFHDDPTIMRDRTIMGSGISWEIHPIFVNALHMSNTRPISGSGFVKK
jgi:hypothetical protein